MTKKTADVRDALMDAVMDHVSRQVDHTFDGDQMKSISTMLNPNFVAGAAQGAAAMLAMMEQAGLIDRGAVRLYFEKLVKEKMGDG